MRFGVASSSSKKESKLPELVVAMIEEFLDAPMPEPKASKSTMLPHKPEDWPSLFEQHLNAGDLDAVMALYEPDARFVARSGETIVGRDRIRDVLAGMIQSKTKFQSRVIKAITVDDVALLYTDFQGTTVDASGKTIEVRSQGDRGPSPAAGRRLETHRGRPQRPRMRTRDATNQTHFHFVWLGRSFGGMSATWLVTITADGSSRHAHFQRPDDLLATNKPRKNTTYATLC